MRLTKFTDYSLRVLLYAATLEPDQLTTINETAEFFGISRAHVKKVVMQLIREGFLAGVRGRNGGFCLALPTDQINLGKVLRETEPDFDLAECFLAGNVCRITKGCGLPNVMSKALANFLATFDGYTLADMIDEQGEFTHQAQRVG